MSDPGSKSASPIPITRRLTGASERPASLSRTLSDSPSRSQYASPLALHLYDGLLQGTLTDVKISAHGRIYSLHRLVLAQSDYFRSLLAGGFSEQSESTVIPLRLDVNCSSRAAFELCIARLYGGGPQLEPPSTSRPDPMRGYPLTEVFARQSAGLAQVDEPLYDPTEVHIATPQFLLSLLATALYLELPSIVQQALHLIQETITPYTVSVYLKFALGGGVPPLSDESLAGLAHISVPALDHCDATPSHTASDYFYGETAERIGEACACWMSRWAGDILPVEVAQGDAALPAIRVFSWSGLGGISSEWLRVLLSSDALFIDRGDPLVELGTTSEERRYEMAKQAVELRRRQKRAWEAADDARRASSTLFSSSLHVADQTGSSSRARRSTLTSLEDVGDDDEAEYDRLFGEGIYLSHLVRFLFWSSADYFVEEAQPFEMLQEFMTDISPITGRAYVSSEVLFRAHWDASRLRNSTPVDTSDVHLPGEHDKTRASLGLSVPFRSTASIPAAVAPSSCRRWVVPIDETMRVNETAPTVSGADFDTTSPPTENAFSSSPLGNAGKPVVRSKQGAWQPGERYFGLANPIVTADTAERSLAGLEGRSFVAFEPCRFSIEFWDIDSLRERQRLYSHTISYAGSSFNVYLQVLRKTKGRIQLCARCLLLDGMRFKISRGIYLHRQSPHATAPAASKPPTLSAAEIATNPRPMLQATDGEKERDSRSNVKAFFSLTCHNLAGTSFTRFASAPDSFSYSQSWGWKSSSLRGEELLVKPNGTETKAELKRLGRYLSLRCSVVLGVV